MIFPKGSEWRKWDLHVHSPYSYESKYRDWASFVAALKEKAVEHDVEVVGINDYFTIDGYEKLLQEDDVDFNNGYPRIMLDNGKFLYIFPIIELRLDHFADNATAVNIHIIFNPKFKSETIRESFLEKLSIVYDGITLNCKKNELIKIGVASVNKAAFNINIDTSIIPALDKEKYLKQALHEIVLSGFDFSTKAEQFKKLILDSGFKSSEFIIIIANRGHGGLDEFKWHDQYHQTGRSATIRKNLLHISDACFSNSESDKKFLLGEKLPQDMGIEDFKRKIGGLKPVIWGSDAHEPINLFHPSRGGTNDYTWIKADPTFEGLHQILVEPKDRIAIQATKPDKKEPYKVINRITFTGSGDFPSTPIELNPNLVSIIGSRSSGKSALLAYIAHAINPEDTVLKQADSQEGIKQDEIGPAAGKSWEDVSNIACKVEWASETTEGGKVVYIPQNYLYSISNRPSEITNKIEPVLFRKFPEVKAQYEKTVAAIENSNQNISDNVNQWFEYRQSIDILISDLQELGDKRAVQTVIDTYQKQIDEVKDKLSITNEDIQLYQEVTKSVAEKETRQSEINQEKSSLAQFLNITDKKVGAIEITPTISFYPSIDNFPLPLNKSIDDKITEFKSQMSRIIKQEIIDYYSQLCTEMENLKKQITKILTDNEKLIETNKQNEQLTLLVKAVNDQNVQLAKITEKETQIESKNKRLKALTEAINTSISARSKSLQELVKIFSTLEQSIEKISFSVEYDYDDKNKLVLADKFNRQYASPYLDEQQVINLKKITSDVDIFLESIYTGKQRLKAGLDKKLVIKDILCATEEIRFTAVMEEDKIGGFGRSTMTPGKRALFALTLMLNETDGAWPLLIDQPEDDLDSRSLYDQIVPYLCDRKKERQIIMVSHNANLVVGADSEQIIVANKHGDDRKNKDNRMFSYLSGSLESSKQKTDIEYILESCGIREHACEILDGGTEAFEKRKNQYRI